jgi:hypothetical protein
LPQAQVVHKVACARFPFRVHRGDQRLQLALEGDCFAAQITELPEHIRKPCG